MIYPGLNQYPFLPETMTFWYFIVFVVGTCIGSFLNVCIWRIPRGESLMYPSSHCPKCGHEISWFENIPLVSWLALRAKCSKCKEKISGRYFFVELLTGMIFLLFWHKTIICFLPVSMFLVYIAIIMLVVTTIYIDAEHRIIPNEMTYSVMICGLILSVAFPENWELYMRLANNVFHQNIDFNNRVFSFAMSFSGLAFGIIFFLVFSIAGRIIFKRDALGLGDVKYLGAVGACLGIGSCFFTVLIGSLLGSFAGLLMIFLGKRKRLRSAIPFGPYLAAGTVIWELAGRQLLDFYFALILALK